MISSPISAKDGRRAHHRGGDAFARKSGLCHLRDAPSEAFDSFVSLSEPAPESVHAAPVVSSSAIRSKYASSAAEM